MILYDSFARKEMNIPDPDSCTMAGFLHRVVESSAKDGEYIDVALRTRREKVTEGGDGFGEHGGVGVESHDLRRGHKTAGSLPADDEIPVGELRSVQFIYTRVSL
jgi:hypothetical protein